MNPEQGLNIDTMLSQFDQKEQTDIAPNNASLTLEPETTEAVLPNEAHSDTTTPVNQIVSHDVSPSSDVQTSSVAPVKFSKVSVLNQLRSLPASMRTLASALATVIVLVIGGWILSVQYPQEATSIKSAFFTTFSSLVGSSKKNLNPSPLVAYDDEDIHAVAPEQVDFDVESPLADALQEQQQALTGDSSYSGFDDFLSVGFSGSDNQDDMDDTIVNLSGTLSYEDDVAISSPHSQSGETLPSTYNPDFDLPGETLPTLSQFFAMLGELSDKAEIVINNPIGMSSSYLATMRVIKKNMQDIMADLRKNPTVTQELYDRYYQFDTLFDKSMQ